MFADVVPDIFGVLVMRLRTVCLVVTPSGDAFMDRSYSPEKRVDRERQTAELNEAWASAATHVWRTHSSSHSAPYRQGVKHDLQDVMRNKPNNNNEK